MAAALFPSGVLAVAQRRCDGTPPGVLLGVADPLAPAVPDGPLEATGVPVPAAVPLSLALGFALEDGELGVDVGVPEPEPEVGVPPVPPPFVAVGPPVLGGGEAGVLGDAELGGGTTGTPPCTTTSIPPGWNAICAVHCPSGVPGPPAVAATFVL